MGGTTKQTRWLLLQSYCHFVRNLGIAMGLATCGSGIGQMVISQLLQASLDRKANLGQNLSTCFLLSTTVYYPKYPAVSL